MISGRGSNLRSLLEHAEYYSIVSVVSDNPAALGLQIAEEFGVETFSFARNSYQTRSDFKQAIFQHLRRIDFKLVALAGFMQIVPADFVDSYYGQIVNIHPSLLPAYPGLDTHRRVLTAGERYHGCSVHFVDNGVDTGPIIAQARLQCLRGENPDELAARVLKLEHMLYPWVVNCLARSVITLDGRRVLYAKQAMEEAENLGFILPGLESPEKEEVQGQA